MKNPRILCDYAITPLPVQAGGIESSARETVEGLLRANIEVFPVHFRLMLGDTEPEVSSRTSSNGDFTWQEIRVPYVTREMFTDDAFSWRTVDEQIVEKYFLIFEEVKPDLIVINAFPWFQYYLALAAKRSGIPYFVIHHGFSYKELPYIPLSQNARHRISQWEKEFYYDAACEAFLTEQGRLVFRKDHTHASLFHNKVIPLPVSEIFFKDFSLEKSLEKIPGKIGWVGRWDAIKRPEYLLEISSHLSEDMELHAVSRVKCELSGVTCEDFSAAITVHDPMLPENLRDFYRSCSACILPSAFETFGKVVFEAALCGTPTFITKEVCISDLYREMGMEDFILHGNDAKSDAERIQKFASRGCSEAFLKYVRREHTSSFAYEKLATLIREVVASVR